MKYEDRIYKINGSPEQLDQLDKLFGWINGCVLEGHCGGLYLQIDGDGIGNTVIEKKQSGRYKSIPRILADLDLEEREVFVEYMILIPE